MCLFHAFFAFFCFLFLFYFSFFVFVSLVLIDCSHFLILFFVRSLFFFFFSSFLSVCLFVSFSLVLLLSFVLDSVERLEFVLVVSCYHLSWIRWICFLLFVRACVVLLLLLFVNVFAVCLGFCLSVCFLFLFFFFSFFFLWPHSAACGLLVPLPEVRPEPPGWEHWVQDAGPPENSWAQGILISICSPGGIHLDTKRRLHQPPFKLQCWTLHAKQPGRQEHSPTISRQVAKVILSSQTPQSTPPDATLPIRGKRLSSTHQSTGNSPSHQEAYTSPWTNLIHQASVPHTTESRGPTTLQPVERKPQTC